MSLVIIGDGSLAIEVVKKALQSKVITKLGIRSNLSTQFEADDNVVIEYGQETFTPDLVLVCNTSLEDSQTTASAFQYKVPVLSTFARGSLYMCFVRNTRARVVRTERSEDVGLTLHLEKRLPVVPKSVVITDDDERIYHANVIGNTAGNSITVAETELLSGLSVDQDTERAYVYSLSQDSIPQPLDSENSELCDIFQHALATLNDYPNCVSFEEFYSIVITKDSNPAHKLLYKDLYSFSPTPESDRLFAAVIFDEVLQVLDGTFSIAEISAQLRRIFSKAYFPEAQIHSLRAEISNKKDMQANHARESRQLTEQITELQTRLIAEQENNRSLHKAREEVQNVTKKLAEKAKECDQITQEKGLLQGENERLRQELLARKKQLDGYWKDRQAEYEDMQARTDKAREEESVENVRLGKAVGLALQRVGTVVRVLTQAVSMFSRGKLIAHLVTMTLAIVTATMLRYMAPTKFSLQIVSSVLPVVPCGQFLWLFYRARSLLFSSATWESIKCIDDINSVTERKSFVEGPNPFVRPVTPPLTPPPTPPQKLVTRSNPLALPNLGNTCFLASMVQLLYVGQVCSDKAVLQNTSTTLGSLAKQLFAESRGSWKLFCDQFFEEAADFTKGEEDDSGHAFEEFAKVEWKNFPSEGSITQVFNETPVQCHLAAFKSREKNVRYLSYHGISNPNDFGQALARGGSFDKPCQECGVIEQRTMNIKLPSVLFIVCGNEFCLLRAAREFRLPIFEKDPRQQNLFIHARDERFVLVGASLFLNGHYVAVTKHNAVWWVCNDRTSEVEEWHVIEKRYKAADVQLMVFMKEN